VEPDGHAWIQLVAAGPGNSAGIGVTPVLAMLGALAEKRSRRPITWIHVARCGAASAFSSEARQLIAVLPRARSYVLYTRPRREDRPGKHYDAKGLLAREHLTALPLSPHVHAYVCGPGGSWPMSLPCCEASVCNPLRYTPRPSGRPAAQGRAGPHLPSPPATRGPDVSFVRSGISARFDRERWGSLLELAESCDVPVSWSCRTGVCHRCESAMGRWRV